MQSVAQSFGYVRYFRRIAFLELHHSGLKAKGSRFDANGDSWLEGKLHYFPSWSVAALPY
jgi:hypothetical protein